MKKILIVIGSGLVLIISILLIRTTRFTAKQIEVQGVTDVAIDSEEIAQRLAKALSFQTVSYLDSTQFDGEAFLAFHEYLEEVFPSVHAFLKKEMVNNYSLLYTWEGHDTTLKPILLMAHQDVVPVIPGTEKNWSYPPFEGKSAEGYIWGRGALDDKYGVMGILEAVEALLQDGFRPKRTVYLAFGHDEELGGLRGAAKIVELLQSRNIQPEFVLDEGGEIVQDIIPGVTVPVALVGIAEKGYVSLKLTVNSEGGHSSMPPKHTAIGILSKAITKLEENPFPANLKYLAQNFQYIGYKMSFFQRVLFGNLWLFGPVIESKLSTIQDMNPYIRTTTAATMINAGVKDNVLPIDATAVVNFRILPGESSASVVNYVKKIVADPRVQVSYLDTPNEPSPVSDIHSNSYEIIEKTIDQISIDEELIVAPNLLFGGTDSRYYTDLSNNVYRFAFVKLGPDDLKRFHGTNERISIDNYAQAVTFYYQLLRNAEEL